jgi:hypothetical protein
MTKTEATSDNSVLRELLTKRFPASVVEDEAIDVNIDDDVPGTPVFAEAYAQRAVYLVSLEDVRAQLARDGWSSADGVYTHPWWRQLTIIDTPLLNLEVIAEVSGRGEMDRMLELGNRLAGCEPLLHGVIPSRLSIPLTGKGMPEANNDNRANGREIFRIGDANWEARLVATGPSDDEGTGAHSMTLSLRHGAVTRFAELSPEQRGLLSREEGHWTLPWARLFFAELVAALVRATRSFLYNAETFAVDKTARAVGEPLGVLHLVGGKPPAYAMDLRLPLPGEPRFVMSAFGDMSPVTDDTDVELQLMFLRKAGAEWVRDKS